MVHNVYPFTYLQTLSSKGSGTLNIECEWGEECFWHFSLGKIPHHEIYPHLKRHRGVGTKYV